MLFSLDRDEFPATSFTGGLRSFRHVEGASTILFMSVCKCAHMSVILSFLNKSVLKKSTRLRLVDSEKRKSRSNFPPALIAVSRRDTFISFRPEAWSFMIRLKLV